MDEAMAELRRRAQERDRKGENRDLSELIQQMEDPGSVQLARLANGSPGRWVDLISSQPPPTRDYAFSILGDGIGRDIPRHLERIESMLGKRRLEASDCIYFLDYLQGALRDALSHGSGNAVRHTDMQTHIERIARTLSQSETITMLDVVTTRRRLYQTQGSRSVNGPLMLAVTLADLARKGR
jgi:hypothetical protein